MKLTILEALVIGIYIYYESTIQSVSQTGFCGLSVLKLDAFCLSAYKIELIAPIEFD